MKLQALPTLRFPARKFRIRQGGTQKRIWDSVRGQWVALTPEEWVRQHLIGHLTEDCHIPRSWLSIERQAGKGRYDVAIFDRQGIQRAIFECKAPSVRLTESVLFQAMQYLQGPTLFLLGITNGLHHFYWVRPPGKNAFHFHSTIPPQLRKWLREAGA